MNRLTFYSFVAFIMASVSLVILSQFFYTKFDSLSFMCRCRLTALLILHLFFIFMVYRLNKTESSFAGTIQWLLEISGGMFLICTIAYTIGYLKSPRILRSIKFFEINLDPIDRIAATLWTHFFSEIWIYSTVVFFALLFIIIIIKVKAWH